ncbi:hypothetical protein B0H17DRAFT_1203147 [Mycena rosella]|uniref:Uncharacterized protein n=1 Tax=Mycena rosella TaxID=1033263 RepID=A0AAD7GCI4_MYCRO|nr:hypothetical protein B0H17DRAFT_1203147 [Mycena rosella]
MALMEPDAWKVQAASSVVEGIDLLKNRPGSLEGLGALDRRVAAHVEMGSTSYFITTNARYVPLLPEVDSKVIVMRRDMRFGPDDHVLWPRLYSDRFCHLPAIPRAPTSPQGQEELGVMWWNATPADFTRYQTLHENCAPLPRLIDEYEQYVKSLPIGMKPPLLFPQIVQRLRLGLERLTIPSTYVRMVLGVTTVQRKYLELTGLLRYMRKYKPRLEGIEDPAADHTHPDYCIGCFTDDPRIAQLCWKACLPCWLIRPLKAFADERIWKVVVPFEATTFLEMKTAAGFTPVSALRLEDRPYLVRHVTENTPWYRNPFRTSTPDVASASSAGASHVEQEGEESARAGARRNPVSAPSRGKGSPFKALKETKGLNPKAKPAHDRFLPFNRPEMLSTITPWATALAAIDRSRPPSCGIDLPQLYVLPEPALLASPEDEARRRMLYHHYRLMRDALMFRLADRSQPHELLTTQQWRDILQGKVIKQGKAGTRAQVRSASLEELLSPAFSACGIDALEEFPVPPEAIPPMHVHTTKELLWELAEINFRYEFLALDARASGLDRPGECRKCFAGDGLIAIDFRESQRGLAAISAMDRLPYLLYMAELMRSWSVPCQRPHQIESSKGRTDWDDHAVRSVERGLAQYYTQSFYELFGRAAVVPMRLEHEIAS